MKKTLIFTLIIISLFSSCNTTDSSENEHAITLNFSHSWDNNVVTNADFNTIKFTNANGEPLSISKLRYIISNVVFTTSSGKDIVLNNYHLIDVSTNNNLNFQLEQIIPQGTYTNVSFIFGLNNDTNYANHQDLNSVSWNVPEMLGGGYHYMQLEGKFVDKNNTETGYAYHAIRAVDNSGATPVFQDTFFKVDLGSITITEDTTFNIEMNIAEWFKNPNTWDLNALNNMLMPNFNAQILMFENGQNVFSLTSVEP